MATKKLRQYMMVVCVGVLILSASHAKAQLDCITGILPSLAPCQSFLSNLLPLLPGSQCCDAAKNFLGMGDTKVLCQCLKPNMLASGILPSKLGLIPNLCSLTAFLPIVNCLVPPPTA